MRKMWKAAACALLGLAMPAQAGCWTASEREAARVRELQTMLMVASLRCHAAGIEITEDYNGFVRAARDDIEAANLRIKTHFAAEGGSQVDYDRFTTLLANSYGDDQTDAASCAEAAGIARAAKAAPATLLHLATQRLFPRMLPNDVCAKAREMADATPNPPATAAQVVVLAIATPPAPGVVRLPDDVAAALAVMARYGTPAAPAATTASPTQLAAVVR